MAYLEKVTLGSDEVKVHGRSKQHTKPPVTLTPGQCYTFDAPGYITLECYNEMHAIDASAYVYVCEYGAYPLAQLYCDVRAKTAVYVVPGLEYAIDTTKTDYYDFLFMAEYFELVID